MRTLVLVLACMFLFGCQTFSGASNDVYADTIFVGPNIVTMDPANPDASAVAVRGEIVIRVGQRESVSDLIGPDTRIVNLGKKALIPGLIDASGRFLVTARAIEFDNEATKVFESQLRDTALKYASYGITTAHDPATNPADIAAIRSIAESARLPIDIAVHTAVELGVERDYGGGFRVAGSALASDPSPQGRRGFPSWANQGAIPYEAFHAMTLGAAKQYSEDQRKGSIAPGKQADLVILSSNPLQTDSSAAQSIRVLKTLARGQIVFDAECTRLDGKAIEAAFSDVVDEADILHSSGGHARNRWFSDGRFSSDWVSGKSHGLISGKWYVQNDRRCVVADSGVPEELLGKESCRVLSQCGDTIRSAHADGTEHAAHRLSALPAAAD